MQAVPTTVVRGPDGWHYVGQLTGFPFPQGGARVYRIPPEGGTPEIYASGFTNIIDIVFGPEGALYVLEFDSNGLTTAGSTGALIKVGAGGTHTTIASTGLTNPGGVAFGPDGRIYVTNMAVAPGGGQVLRVTP
jgi:sugar lactone lactonase YvrE